MWWNSKQNKCLCVNSRPMSSLKKMLLVISQNSQENINARITFWVFSCNFCEICKKTLFVEQQRTTPSNSSSFLKGVLANETVNYDAKTKPYLLICTISVSYHKEQSRWNNRFQKQSFADFKLGVLKNL